MFWFTLLEAFGAVGFPRPEQMAAGLSCDLPGTETVTWPPCSAHVSPVSEVARATCELRVGRTRKPWEFQRSQTTSDDYNVFADTDQRVPVGDMAGTVLHSW